jgi:hypothetical protein
VGFSETILSTTLQGIESKKANFICIFCVLLHIPLDLRIQLRFEGFHSALFIKTYHLLCLFNIMKNSKIVHLFIGGRGSVVDLRNNATSRKFAGSSPDEVEISII